IINKGRVGAELAKADPHRLQTASGATLDRSQIRLRDPDPSSLHAGFLPGPDFQKHPIEPGTARYAAFKRRQFHWAAERAREIGRAMDRPQALDIDTDRDIGGRPDQDNVPAIA